MLNAAVLILTLLVTSFIAALPASAQADARAVSLTPFFGGYTFDGSQDLKTKPVFGLRAGYSLDDKWDLEGVLDYVSTTSKSGQGDASALNVRVDGLYNIRLNERLVPFLAAGAGVNTVEYPDGSGDGTSTRAALNYGGGIRYFVSDAWALRGDIRHILVIDQLDRVLGNLEYTVGLNFFFGTASAAAAAAAAPADSDGDGVTDDLDRCPNTPKGTAVERNGCPLDSDGDGVTDDLDRCPNTPKGTAVDGNGCPLDSDGDGVTDDLDRCLNTPKGVAVDGNGCPPVIEERTMRLNIEFDTDKADIKPQYFDELKRVADVMNANPDITVEIGGHTDNTGSEAYNNDLSARRANSVKDYLVEKFGISADRLKAVGYGPSRPVADNSTSEGRQKNRRIEAVIDYTVKR